MKMSRFSFLAIGFFLTFCSLAQGQEYRCVKAFPQQDSRYPALVCEGNGWLERGQVRKALDAYTRASEFRFHEGPNFFIYYRIASAQCRLADRKAARETLAAFESMLALFVGEKKCADTDIVGSMASSVMCSEAFDPDSYADSRGKSLRARIVKEYRERIHVLKRSC